jgi:hypothetical protein
MKISGRNLQHTSIQTEIVIASSSTSLLLLLNRDTGMVLNDIGTVLGNLVPVYDVPPGAYVLRSTVLVFQVISVLPNIQTKDWEFDFVGNTLHERIVLVGSAYCVIQRIIMDIEKQ